MNILKTIRREKPTTVKDMEDVLGLDIIYIGSGISRDAYAISGTRFVVKFPMEDAGSKTQTRREIRRIQQVLHRKALKHVRRYVPKIYYTDYKNGIIIMELLHRVAKVPHDVCIVVEQMFQDTFRTKRCVDVYGDNLGYNSRGQIKVLDWGCV